MKLKPAPHVFDLSGLSAHGIISRTKSHLVLRRHRPGPDRQSPAQLAVRNSFKHCGSLFRSLPPSAREWLDKYALPRPLTSSAVFVRDNRTPVQNRTLLSPVPSNPYVPSPQDLLFSTPDPAPTEDGRILATWSDNSPTAFTKLQLLIRFPSDNFFFLTLQPNADLETYLITGLDLQTFYDCYAYFLDPIADECGTSAGQLSVLSSAYEPPPPPDYVGSGAGTSDANGHYYEYTTSDGVPNFKHSTKNFYIYRSAHFPAKRWIVGSVLDGIYGEYVRTDPGDTPPLGLYDVLDGIPPGVTIAEG